MVDYRRYTGYYNNPNQQNNAGGGMTYGQGSRQAGSPYFSWESNQPAPVDRTASASITPDESRRKEEPLTKNIGYLNDLAMKLEASGDSELAQFLRDYAMGGIDPTSQDSITKLQESAARIAGLPSYYSPEEAGRVSGMITGKQFDEGIGGNIRSQITRVMAPQRESLRSILGAQGQAGNPDAMASAVMNVADESNRTFQDLSTKYLMEMFTSGTAARAQGEEGMMGRERLMGEINQFIPKFTEDARGQRADVGLGLEKLDRDTLMQLLQTLYAYQSTGKGADWLGPAIQGATTIGAAGMK